MVYPLRNQTKPNQTKPNQTKPSNTHLQLLIVYKDAFSGHLMWYFTCRQDEAPCSPLERGAGVCWGTSENVFLTIYVLQIYELFSKMLPDNIEGLI